jgi:ATP-dependent exoDNAse (exonuclease V) beta subunit
MARFDGTAEQMAAIESTAPHFMVRAAAGAGKTSVLVQRYLRHVLDEGCDPTTVLAFTFTAAAAAEMRLRIVRALRDAGARDEAQAAETGPVSTMHAFCDRLLRENALEAAVDPGFKVADSLESMDIISNAIREVLAETELERSGEITELLGELTGRTAWGSTGPYDMLATTIREVLEAFRGQSLTPDELESSHASEAIVIERWQQLMLRDLPSEIAAELAEDVGKPGFHARLQGVIKERKRQPWPKWSKAHALSEPDAARRAVAVASLAAESWRRIDSRMEASRRYDFSALESKAVRLLEESPATRHRMAATYKHVLVDEAQDLNPVQYRLLEALQPASLMLVGDGQQSIYGFRHADLESFEQQADELPVFGLTKNHRSAEPILRFVDLVARSMWGGDYVPMMPEPEFDLDQPSVPGSAEYPGVELWLTAGKDEAQAVANWVKQLIDEGEDPRRIGVLVRKADFGEKLARSLTTLGIAARMVAGERRFFTRLEIRDVANAMRSLTDPEDDFSLLATLYSPFCGLRFDSVALLAEGHGVRAKLGAFESPIPGDGEKLQRFLGWFEPLAARAGRLTAWETLSSLLASSDYMTALASRPRSAETLANVRKLFAQASSHPEFGTREFALRISDTESHRHREQGVNVLDEDDPTVRILTVHRAKGLEFPVTVFAETMGKNKSGNEREVNPREGVFSPWKGQTAPPIHTYIESVRRAKEAAEMRRLLYVAMTRAQSRLAVVTSRQASLESPAGIVRSAVGLDHGTTPSGFRIREVEPERKPDER